MSEIAPGVSNISLTNIGTSSLMPSHSVARFKGRAGREKLRGGHGVEKLGVSVFSTSIDAPRES